MNLLLQKRNVVDEDTKLDTLSQLETCPEFRNIFRKLRRLQNEKIRRWAEAHHRPVRDEWEVYIFTILILLAYRSRKWKDDAEYIRKLQKKLAGFNHYHPEPEIDPEIGDDDDECGGDPYRHRIRLPSGNRYTVHTEVFSQIETINEDGEARLPADIEEVLTTWPDEKFLELYDRDALTAEQYLTVVVLRANDGNRERTAKELDITVGCLAKRITRMENKIL